MKVIWIAAVLLFLSGQAFAQDDPFIQGEPTVPRPLGEVIDTPKCFRVINRAPYTVLGNISSNYYINSDGIKVRHRSNFRLASGEGAEFCTSGPFYPGNKVDLVLRTLIPIFRCKTAITGDIVIHGRHKSEGGTETWADCL